jgi:SAM-dependent methyltransferase
LRTISVETAPGNDSAGKLTLKDGNTVVEEITVDVAFEAVAELLENYKFETVLDIGAGNQEHARCFRHMGKSVTTVDPIFPADVQGDFLEYEPKKKFDLAWCSHVVEHQRNVGIFLDKIIACTKPNGIICISVPPEVSHFYLLEHPNQFTGGMLLYHLVLAGIDCTNAAVLTYGYNVSVIVRNKTHSLPRQSWNYDKEALNFLPKEMRMFGGHQLFGPIRQLRWLPRTDVQPHMNSGLPAPDFEPTWEPPKPKSAATGKKTSAKPASAKKTAAKPASAKKTSTKPASAKKTSAKPTQARKKSATKSASAKSRPKSASAPSGGKTPGVEKSTGKSKAAAPSTAKATLKAGAASKTGTTSKAKATSKAKRPSKKGTAASKPSSENT